MTILDNLRISHKVLSALAILALVAVAATAFISQRMVSFQGEYAGLIDRDATSIKTLARANLRLVQSGRLQYRYVVETNLDSMDSLTGQINATREDFTKLIAQSIEMVPSFQDRIAHVQADFTAAFSISTEARELSYDGSREDAINLLRDKYDPILNRAREELSAIIDDVDNSMQSHSEDIAKRANSSIIATGSTVAIGLALSLALALFITSRGIARPLAHLVEVMNDLASGRFTIDVDGQSRKDEIGSMSRSVQVFKENGLAVERMRHEQESAKAKAEQDRRQAMLTLADGFENQVKGIVEGVSSQATELHATASSLSTVAAQASAKSTTVASAADQASSNVQTVASAAEELAVSIQEISRQVAQSASMSHNAVEEAKRTNQIVTSLAAAAQKIGDVVNLITNIAAQTNLLALNATIEAARAGDAGKGFAVVAGEVKHLATQTAKATEDIGQQIAAIQAATNDAVQAIEGITGAIAEINQVATGIASAVEEQGAATQEIARNVQQAALGAREVSTNISGVQQAADEAGHGAEQVLQAASELSRQSENLTNQVDRFISNIRAG